MALKLVEEIVLTGDANSITFSNIPQTGKGLSLIMSLSAEYSIQPYLRLNGVDSTSCDMWINDSGGNYAGNYANFTIRCCGRWDNSTALFGSALVNIDNYASSTNPKPVQAEGFAPFNTTNYAFPAMSMGQFSVGAVTSITMLAQSSYPFKAYSKISLYVRD
jgi:hypothetical protein